MLDRFTNFVTTHNRLVVVAMLVLTAGMLVGMSSMETSQAGGTSAMFPETGVSEKADYIGQQYSQDDGPQAASMVYVREQGGNALSKDNLVAALEYQQTVRQNDSVADTLAADGIRSVPNLVGSRAAGSPNATLAEQITALEAASEREVATLVETTLTENSSALALLPESYEPGTATAESHRMVFQFTDGENGQPPSTAQRALFDAANERDSPDVFTLGEHATAQRSQQMTQNTMELVVPFALVLILGVLAFAYRDVVDVLVGMVGVGVSIVWMFGILGWLGISAGMTMIIGPVLVAGLSIDFGFHVFNRYREQRGEEEGIRLPMARAIRAVALALGLVTVTAAIGFLSNVVNPVGSIREMGIGITLGVAAAFLVFLTLVPALKVSIDGLLERVGLDRHKQPLGESGYLRPLLASTVTLARRAAPIVLVVALVASAGGALAWTTLDQESFQQQSDPAAEWKQDLPAPLAWESPEFQEQSNYVEDSYTAVAADASGRFQILVEGSVTDRGTLDTVADATDRPVFTDTRAQNPLTSPVTVVHAVAAQNDSFAATVAASDTDDDGVPDRNLSGVYDHLYEVAPEQAGQVIERTDGEYRSLRVVGPAENSGYSDPRTDDVRAAASAIESGDGDHTATAVSGILVLESQLDAVTDGIVRVLLLALGAIFVSLVLVFRHLHDSASLGLVTAVPILMVTGLVVGGMAVLDVPLTLVTALLMSLVVGLGIDYNIHVSDRFVQELDAGQSPLGALETAVTGTGGALLGSTLTSAAAFVSLLLHPHPQLQSFGVLVILTLLTAFVVSVVVLPSLLVLWVRHGPTAVGSSQPVSAVAPSEDD
jgi:predicted RND superfamily exporter protein